MPSTVLRRPLPALISLVALLLLTGIVWWRVLHRDSGHAATPKPCPTTSTAATAGLPSPSSVTVIVLNSTSRSGIAARARSVLAQDGFNVPALAKNDSPKNRNKIEATAQIRFGPRGRPAAALLRYYFPGASMVPQPFTSSAVVVSLGTAFTAVAPADAVSRSLLANHVTTAPPSPAATASSSAATASPSPSCT